MHVTLHAPVDGARATSRRIHRDTRCLVVLALASACATAHAAERRTEPTAITLTGPAIVILRPSPAEIAKEEPDDRQKELHADSSATRAAFVKAMRAYPQVRIMDGNVDVVRFREASTPPVWRYSVESGYGYVFYAPGQPVKVFSGSRSAEGLVCEAARMYALKPRPPKCDG